MKNTIEKPKYIEETFLSIPTNEFIHLIEILNNSTNKITLAGLEYSITIIHGKNNGIPGINDAYEIKITHRQTPLSFIYIKDNMIYIRSEYPNIREIKNRTAQLITLMALENKIDLEPFMSLQEIATTLPKNNPQQEKHSFIAWIKRLISQN